MSWEKLDKKLKEKTFAFVENLTNKQMECLLCQKEIKKYDNYSFSNGVIYHISCRKNIIYNNIDNLRLFINQNSIESKIIKSYLDIMKYENCYHPNFSFSDQDFQEYYEIIKHLNLYYRLN